MMRTELSQILASVAGSMRFTEGSTSFQISSQPTAIIVDFASMGSLLRVRREAEALKKQIASLPALPLFRKSSKEPATPEPALNNWSKPIWIQVKGRPVGRLDDSHGELKFKATPLRFFTRNRF